MLRFIGISLVILFLFSASFGPALAVEFSTFAGGGMRECAYDLVIDDQGNVLVLGLTGSDDFPVTPGVSGGSYAGGASDLFVIKLSPDLGTLISSTYIGGSDSDGLDFLYDYYVQFDTPGPAMTLDAAGSVLVTGSTMSLDFPTTAGAFCTAHHGVYEDAFLLRLSPDLATLQHSTLFGGEHKDWGQTLVVESGGTVVVGGDTRSQQFPVTAGAFDTSYNGGTKDVFLVRFSHDLSTLTAGTFFGGDSDEYNRALLRDGSGRYYLTGWAVSENLPSTPGAYDLDHNGGARDVYIALFSADFSSLEACTYFGGHDWGEPFHGGEHEGGCDEGIDLIFDAQGNLVLVGTTHSKDFPITPGVIDTVFNDGESQSYDAFVAVFTADLSSLLHSSYLGGRHLDKAYSVVLDANGDLVIAGGTHSIDFQVTPGAFDTGYSGEFEGFVIRLSPDLGTLHYGSYMGGGSFEQAYVVALDSTGLTAFLAGYTFSADFQHPGTGYDHFHNGSCDAFVLRTDLGHSVEQTIEASLAAAPASGTLPFSSMMCVDLPNLSEYPRNASGSLNIWLPGGQYYPNYRSGFTNLAPAETFHFCWSQWFPDLPALDGSILFQMVAQDVTPAPYNQPPYPPSGSVATDSCTVTAWRP
jgi:hypothetical protein